MSTEAAPQPPVIPDYELLRLIGRGAYGEVWLARGVTGVYRAVKLVWRDRFPEAGPYEREFHGLKEFAAISLTESRQLALLHVSRDPAAAYFYYVMELADDITTGRTIDPANYTPHTLKEMRVRRGRLPAGECVTLGVELARALSGLHVRGLVHRDIKPSNVIIVGGAPKLADIGLVTEASAALTFVGTEGFVPPEGPGAPGADVFALGKLLYELVTGLDRHDYPRLPPELHAWPDRKEVLELNEVLIRACEPHPAQRHTDAAALLDDLLLLQAGKSVRRLRKAERRLARALRIAAVFALIAGVAGLGAYLERQRANEETVLRAKAEAERDALARQAIYSAALAQAQRALEQDDYGRARQLLEDSIPKEAGADLRGFEWHALWREAQGDPAGNLRTRGPGVSRMAVSADGRLLAVRDNSATLSLIDPQAATERRLLDGMVSLAGFSADGQWVIGCTKDLALRRWRTDDGRSEPPLAPGINRLVGVFGDAGCVVFTDSPDASPHLVRGWDLAGKTELWRWPVTGSAASRPDYFRASLSADGSLLALVLINGRGAAARWELQVVETRTGQRVFHAPAIDRITALAFSPDGRELAVANGALREIALLDLGTAGWRWRKKVGRSQLDALAISPDGQFLAAGGRDAKLYVLTTKTGKPVTEKRGQAAGITSLAWLKSDSSLLAGGNGGDIRRYTLQDEPKPAELAGLWAPAGGGRRASLSADGRWLAATQDGKNVLLAPVDDLGASRTVTGLAAPVAFSREGDRLLGITEDQRIAWYSLAAPAAPEIVSDERLAGLSYALGVSTDLSSLALPDYFGSLRFWHWPGRQPVTVTKAHVGGALWAALSANGSLAVSGGLDLTVRLWQPATGQPLGAVRVDDALSGAISPDQRWLGLGLHNGNLEVRALPDLQLLRSIRTTSATLIDVAISAKGDRLFAAGTNGAIHVFSTTDWREIIALRLQPAGIAETTIDRLALSADDRTLAAYTNDGRVRIWRH